MIDFHPWDNIGYALATEHAHCSSGRSRKTHDFSPTNHVHNEGDKNINMNKISSKHPLLNGSNDSSSFWPESSPRDIIENSADDENYSDRSNRPLSVTSKNMDNLFALPRCHACYGHRLDNLISFASLVGGSVGLLLAGTRHIEGAKSWNQGALSVFLGCVFAFLCAALVQIFLHKCYSNAQTPSGSSQRCRDVEKAEEMCSMKKCRLPKDLEIRSVTIYDTGKRPNISDIIDTFARCHLNRTSTGHTGRSNEYGSAIGVLTCGPAGLKVSVKKAVHNSAFTDMLQFREEIFEL